MESDAQRLMALFRVEAKQRNAFWRDRLNAAFWPARLGSFTPAVMQDERLGFLSYRLGRDERNGGEPAQEPAGLVDWAVSQGVGLILWPSDEPQPLWAFSLGDVLSYRLYGTAFAPRFWNEPEDRGEADRIEEIENAWVGEPNDTMFPPPVRYAVRRVMRERLGIREPKVMLIKRNERASRLVFALDPEELGGTEATVLAFAKVAWCVPSCIPLYRADHLVGEPSMRPF